MTAVIEWIVAAGEAELAADRLWALGASAVAELPADDGAVRLVADVPDGAAPPPGAVLRGVRDQDLPGVPSGSWRAGGFVLHTPDVTVDDQSGRAIVLDAEGAFGAGSHPTTRLCLEALAMCADRLRGARVLDLGSGTGVLGIAAACSGAAQVVAVELDPAARHRTEANAAANGVGDRLTVAGATVDDVPVHPPFDVVLMNVLLPVHREAATLVTERLAPDGLRVLSGFLAEQAEEVVALHGGGVVRRWETDGWVAVVVADQSSETPERASATAR